MCMIEYIIPHSDSDQADTKVSITDMMGRDLHVLVDEKQLSGAYAIPFEWQRLSNGVYYILIEVDGVRHSRMKMILT